MNRVKSALIACLTVLAVLAANSEQGHGVEIEKLSRGIVKIISGNTVASGVVIEIRGSSNEAFILTALSNIENSKGIEVQFPNIFQKRWEGKLLNYRVPDYDVALLQIRNPPKNVPEISFCEEALLEDEVCYFEYRGERGLVKQYTYISDFDGSYIIFPITVDKKMCGGAMFYKDEGAVVGMMQKKKENEQVCNRALKSGVLAAILDSWGHSIQLVKCPPEVPRLLTFSLSPRFALTYDKLFPFSKEWRWESNKGMTLKLTFEFATKGELSNHRFGLIYSRFSSKPMRDNPMGKLHSTYIVPIYNGWGTIKESKGKRFGGEFTLGLFGLAWHTLENGKFPADTLSFFHQQGTKDILYDDSFLAFMELAFAYYPSSHLGLLIGYELHRLSVGDEYNYYHGFYLGGNLRVSP